MPNKPTEAPLLNAATLYVLAAEPPSGKTLSWEQRVELERARRAAIRSRDPRLKAAINSNYRFFRPTAK